MSRLTSLDALQARADLSEFGSNSILLFALELHFGIEDSATTAASSITDGPDDKKADLVYIDEDRGAIVIAQGYMGTSNKASAPSNKASDLNTAVAWLLNPNAIGIPDNLLPHAQSVHRAIRDGFIDRLLIWYVHNQPESQNVAGELDIVCHSALSILEKHFPNSIPEVIAQEVGQQTLEQWHHETLAPILVTDDFTFDLDGGYELAADDWRAFVTAISGEWLYEQFRLHKTRLFSANVRDYLGSRNSDANINNGIKFTAVSDAGHFWVFNNGLTALVNSFEVDGKSLRISGLSIVNGAQTTGALGSLESSPPEGLRIPIRFVECSSQQTIQQIVRYNNSQNKISPPDFRSNDRIQKRLRAEIGEISDLEYGSRRGGHEDKIRRPTNFLPSITAAQAMAAFQGRPEVAYHQKTRIWEDDNLYSKFFSDATTGSHVLTVYSLQRAIETKKLSLTKAVNAGPIGDIENDQLQFFRHRGSIFLLISAIAASIEIILGKPYPSRFDVRFSKNMSLSKAIATWAPIVEVSSSFTAQLIDGARDLRASDAVKAAIKQFRSLLSATSSANQIVFQKIRDTIA